MPKLKRGAVTIDLVDGSIHGDLDHCLREDLLESAQALLELLPQVKHKGLWGLGKAYDADCYLYTAAKRYSPPDGLNLEAECPSGSCRQFKFTVIVGSDWETHWRHDWYSRLVGSIQGDQVTPDIEGRPDHYRPPLPPQPQRPPKAKSQQMSLPM